ncbi:NUDIX hydrolase [Acidovorax carolinensis]|uniref:NUDIX hydrolase n=1 Tax=Acidovorax carolinensis TaxID=553814 RepID=A0A240UGR2_9BURK|nr:NUDIX domain-containing protein [Acidovorax carolinensis]ART54135.1 NUDIX hydrolase [Acidovorax carolinensis]ART60242.1 NUDIX hydrolase [Acidovorax carolinensis]
MTRAPAASAADWLTTARAAARQPPAQQRLPLWVAGQAVGSVAQGVLSQIDLWRLSDKRYQLLNQDQSGTPVWHLDVAPDAVTPALNLLAQALRAQGQCGPWRNEQLAVCNAAGERLGTVERGAVRLLGLATRAVHLVGRAPDGRMWVQQRARTKPNNPGMWDTLMGGMVSAADTLTQALERETWEEAGLRVPALYGVEHGGQVDFSRPSREGGGIGYMVERIDWFRCTVPEGLEPRNQDGEVERFELWSPAQVRERIAAGDFTLEAGLVLGACCGL